MDNEPKEEGATPLDAFLKSVLSGEPGGIPDPADKKPKRDFSRNDRARISPDGTVYLGKVEDDDGECSRYIEAFFNTLIDWAEHQHTDHPNLNPSYDVPNICIAMLQVMSRPGTSAAKAFMLELAETLQKRGYQGPFNFRGGMI